MRVTYSLNGASAVLVVALFLFWNVTLPIIGLLWLLGGLK